MDAMFEATELFRFNAAVPESNDFDIADIAERLSQIPLQPGKSPQSCSLAEHAVLVSVLVDPPFGLQGLLHKASSAYLATGQERDRNACGPADLYHRLQAAILGRFGLPATIVSQVRLASALAIAIETRPEVPSWIATPAGSACRTRELGGRGRLHPRQAKRLFLERFESCIAYANANTHNLPASETTPQNRRSSCNTLARSN
ncbi:hypothetical protein BKK80_34680 (plasmid) [Cupriavidus malaysiensis]|uniref:Uncharacterized protein n=1 Tax=Cupriavidus malaysiensis TaxID=367825 RepID=A0ABN4TZK9_9BURK|nr:hypothetical protein BKK80_34680 [Cupriavidus malaysiensis]